MIKLKEMKRTSLWQHKFVHMHKLDPWVGLKVQNVFFFSENCHIPYDEKDMISLPLMLAMAELCPFRNR